MKTTKRKALFTLGLGAFSKLGQSVQSTDYLPKNPNRLLTALSLAKENSNNAELASKLLQDKDLLKNIFSLPAVKDLKIDKAELIEALNSVEKDLLLRNIEVQVAKRYFDVLRVRIPELLDYNLIKSIKTAVIARNICEWLGYSRSELAFMGALVADLSIMVMAINNKTQFKILSEKIQAGLGELEAELSVYGYDHNEFGAKLLKYYGFPAEIVDICRNSYDASKVKEDNQTLAKIIAFSEFIAKCFSDKSQSPSTMWSKAQKHLQALDLEISTEDWANKISLLFVKSMEFDILVQKR